MPCAKQDTVSGQMAQAIPQGAPLSWQEEGKYLVSTGLVLAGPQNQLLPPLVVQISTDLPTILLFTLPAPFMVA